MEKHNAPRIIVGQPEHDWTPPEGWKGSSPGLIRGVRHFEPRIFAREGLRETDFSGTTVAVGTVAVQVVTSNENRHEVVVSNGAAAGGATIYLGRDATVSATGPAIGLPLAPGQSITYKHYRGDIWAVGSAPGPTLVSWQEE